MKVLGTPLGSPEYVAQQLHEIRTEHETLFQALQALPELQSSWLLLSLCASTRANYYLRALPPSQSRVFAASHDEAILRTLRTLLDSPGGEDEDLLWASAVAHLPMRMGGLGLRSAARMAPAAYWASWADCLHMIRNRHPTLANLFVRALSEGAAVEQCLRELQESHALLHGEGFRESPNWEQLADGARPQQP